MRGPTLHFTPMKTYNPISVNLINKLEILSLKKFFSLLSRTLPVCLPKCGPVYLTFLFPSLIFFSFFRNSFFFFFFLIWTHGSHCAMCPSLIRVRFCPEAIYLFSVQFISTELSLSYFLTFEIFVKISSLESLATYHLENRKNILTISEFDETFLGD